MFGYSAKNGAGAYSKARLDGVLAADPHKLIVLLFDGAITAIVNASMHMEAGKIAEKGRSIAHAIAIIEGGLRASLNKEVGGELAHNLDALYAYMIKGLFMANVDNDKAKLSEIKNLLSDLRESWEQIAPEKNDQKSHVDPVKSPVDTLSPRKIGHVSA